MKDFNYSYWETKRYFQTFDLIVIGSGIVGLSTAVSYKEKHPNASILILERGLLPDGASTKNAGFACFGTVGELLSDLDSIPADTVWETVQMRWQGLQLLRKRLKDEHIGFMSYGGYELFNTTGERDRCTGQLENINRGINEAIGLQNCFRDLSKQASPFKGVTGTLFNTFEGQIDTALMMQNLQRLALSKGVELLYNVRVSGLAETAGIVEVGSDRGLFRAARVVVATNGFARSLLGLPDVVPARAQVLITEPIPDLKIRGTFHFFQGFYYFRNIDQRLLFGGGRNLDIEGETTSEQGLHPAIQAELEHLLHTMILPGTPVKITQRWSGIMGVGQEKKPIIQPCGTNILAAVRMGGMGIAIGSLVGEIAASQLD
jgi:gamma-glutamylputrescine oxidase